MCAAGMGKRPLTPDGSVGIASRQNGHASSSDDAALIGGNYSTEMHDVKQGSPLRRMMSGGVRRAETTADADTIVLMPRKRRESSALDDDPRRPVRQPVAVVGFREWIFSENSGKLWHWLARSHNPRSMMLGSMRACSALEIARRYGNLPPALEGSSMCAWHKGQASKVIAVPAIACIAARGGPCCAT